MAKSSKTLIVSIFCIFSLIQSSHQTRRIRRETNSKIAAFATKALTSFQKFMKEEGSGQLGLPTLDPVVMDNFNYSLDNSGVGFRMGLEFHSPSLTGLSSYDLHGTNELRSGDSTVLQMTVIFPSLKIRGSYRALGSMFNFFPLLAQGEFEILGTSQVLAVEANVKKNTNTTNTLIVEGINSQFVGGRVKTHFSDNVSDPLSQLTTSFLSSIGSHVFEAKLKPLITSSMNAYMKEWLNGAFSSVSINEILGENSNPQQQQQQATNTNYSGGPPVLPHPVPESNNNNRKIGTENHSNFHDFKPFGN